MKKFLIGCVALYSFNFVIGYVAVHLHGKEHNLAGCKRLMQEAYRHTLAIVTVMPGEANACMDFGLIPSETP